MDIWVVMDSWECEFDFTTHLTEKGALIELCTRVLLYMDSQFSPDAQSLAEPRGDGLTELWKNTLKDNMSGYDGSWLSFDINNWREQSKEELWNFYDFIQEFTWDASALFSIQKTQVMP